MYLFRIFYSFLPLRNPIGFGASDLILLAVAILIALFLVAKAWLAPYLYSVSRRTIPSMAILCLLPILLRLALLPSSPIPIPSGADDFGYLLLGDTLSHFRLANATHPLHQFFESVFVLQQPTYSSIYPLGQGLVLAAGRVLLGQAWLGVLLSCGVFCALCYWMLRGWIEPIWAFGGGLLATIEFGPLTTWLNSYWGGYLSASAGCLVFGALPRLRRSPKLLHGLLLGLGIALQMITRPFESTFLALSVALYLLLALRSNLRSLLKPLLAALGLVCLAFVLILLQNKSVTQSWLTMPYMLSRYQYGVPTTLTFQPNPTPHRKLTQQQELDYKAQAAIHGVAQESISSYLNRLAERFRFLRFFLLPPLYLALPGFLSRLGKNSHRWAAGVILAFILGSNFYPYFFPHYIAAVTCLFLLLSVQGLKCLAYTPRLIVIILCGVSFAFWFFLYASGNQELLSLSTYQSWLYIDRGDPQGRLAVQDQLSLAPGQQLVFVRYSPFHRFEEWVHNAADIDRSRTVWANDLGAQENNKLLRYYPNRTAWLLEPDARPPALMPYPRDSAAPRSVH